jgi:hypothetical protein
MTSHMTRTLRGRWIAAAFVLGGLALLSGCATPTSKFESKWKTASAEYDRYELDRRQNERREPMAAQETRRDLVIEGPWEGKWRSSRNSHSGALRCVLTRTGPDTYAAQYHATYFWIFRYSYSMPLKVERRDEAYNVAYFDGETNLGGLSGKFQYSGHASADEFMCTYRSGTDYGYFEMTRPGFSRIPVARAD